MKASTVKKPAAQLVLGVRLASRTLVRELGFLGKHLAGTNLAPSQVHALLELERFPAIQAADLCNVLRLDKSTVSRLLADLVKRGYIRSAVSRTDGRQRMLSIPAKGRLQLAAIHRAASRQFIAALEVLEEPQWESALAGVQLLANALAATRTARGRGVARAPR